MSNMRQDVYKRQDLQMIKFEVGKEMLLKNKLDEVKDEYDFIIIDCPPSLGLLNTNALTAVSYTHLKIPSYL